MEKNDLLHPLWTGFLKLIRSIFAIEIGIYLYMVWS
jgi:hypothetical protein